MNYITIMEKQDNIDLIQKLKNYLMIFVEQL